MENQGSNQLTQIYLENAVRICVSVCVEDILSALEAASGRKHPSTVQVKQLKTFLPLMPVLRHFVTSPVKYSVWLSSGCSCVKQTCTVCEFSKRRRCNCASWHNTRCRCWQHQQCDSRETAASKVIIFRWPSVSLNGSPSSKNKINLFSCLTSFYWCNHVVPNCETISVAVCTCSL